MAYYSARQKTNGKWYYTCANDVGVFDVGFCSQMELCPENHNWEFNLEKKYCKVCNGLGLVNKNNACPGHDTPEEAKEHYRLWQISESKNGIDTDTQHKCVICEAWTQKYMFFPEGWDITYLCDEHCNKEFLNIATKPKTDCVKKEEPQKSNVDCFIPNNFEEAVDYLIEQSVPVSEPGFHRLGGMSMRNNWGLWGNETPIAKWFTEHELYHGDDRSGILQDAVKAKKNNENFDVIARIKYYQEWWLKTYGEECSLENMRKDFFKHNA